MELLSPSPLPIASVDAFPDHARRRGRVPGRSEEKVFVSVGRSVAKGEGLLRWAFRHFGCREVVLVHVHRPSPKIPTLLGNIPAKQANEASLLMHRLEEWEDSKKVLLNYISLCNRARVKASVMVIENSNISEGIVDLITKLNITKLVMGTATDIFMKVKRSFNKASYTAKNAPPFCEIWFVYKDKHVRTRKVTEDSTMMRRGCAPPTGTPMTTSSPVSLANQQNNLISMTADELLGGGNDALSESCQGSISVISSNNPEVVGDTDRDSQASSKSGKVSSWLVLPAEDTSLPEIIVREEDNQYLLLKSWEEAEASNQEAFSEMLKGRDLEKEVTKVIKKTDAFETARALETKHKKQLEHKLQIVRREKKKLLKGKGEATTKLKEVTEAIAQLDADVAETVVCRDAAEDELKLIYDNIVSLKIERHVIRQQREEAVQQVEWWKYQSHPKLPSYGDFGGLLEDCCDFTEVSLSDLESATCDFSESFKIGCGSFGCVYKGEMLDKSVAIKKLHAHYRQGELEFQQEVEILSRLRHPNIVSLIGVSVEAWCLVYDYMPNGSLHDLLSRRSRSNYLWTWKDRIQAATQILSALMYMHSASPEKVIHGDLKPENILFDSDFNCMVGDCGTYRLAPKHSMYSSSFRCYSEPMGAFSYTDPEYKSTGEFTPKSDIYSFGIVLLQLLTGRPPVWLASEVRRAMLGGKLSSILDTTAGEWPMAVAVRLAEFGLQCCDTNSKDRPELTPVVIRELEEMQILDELPVPYFFQCPILQEIMHDPQIAADGFTYEGKALRSWLENGRETSPMTNLKLDHLNLIPNHALRSAIQDWLRKSKYTS